MSDKQIVWVWSAGPIMLGREDALDAGWDLNGIVVRRCIMAFNPNIPWVRGVALICNKRLYSLFVGAVWKFRTPKPAAPSVVQAVDMAAVRERFHSSPEFQQLIAEQREMHARAEVSDA
jgi:hypothetical protein